MPRKTEFDVTPDKTGEWLIKSGGNADPYRTKREAVDTAARPRGQWASPKSSSARRTARSKPSGYGDHPRRRKG